MKQIQVKIKCEECCCGELTARLAEFHFELILSRASHILNESERYEFIEAVATELERLADTQKSELDES